MQAQHELRATVCAETVFDLEQATQRLSQQFGADVWRPARIRRWPCELPEPFYPISTSRTKPPAHLTRLQHYRLSHYMVLDAVTRRNLELVRTMRQGERQGSVLAVLDETVTHGSPSAAALA